MGMEMPNKIVLALSGAQFVNIWGRGPSKRFWFMFWILVVVVVRQTCMRVTDCTPKENKATFTVR